jgi:hypothetical protein
MRLLVSETVGQCDPGTGARVQSIGGCSEWTKWCHRDVGLGYVVLASFTFESLQNPFPPTFDVYFKNRMQQDTVHINVIKQDHT